MQTRARLGAAACFVMVTVVLTGCGDDEERSGPTTRNTRFPPPAEVENRQIREGEDSCGLLTRTEVESAAAVSVDPGIGVTTKAGNSSCAYRLRGMPTQYVGVILQTPGAPTFDNASKQLGGAAEPLPGVGERAFVASDTAYVLKGDRLLIVTVTTSQPAPARKQAAIQLARSAIGKV